VIRTHDRLLRRRGLLSVVARDLRVFNDLLRTRMRRSAPAAFW